MTIDYSPTERLVLIIVALVSLCGLNVAFLWGLLQPGALHDALTNPVAIGFIGEAFLLLGVLAYLLWKWKVLRVSTLTFVILALVGGIAFALPVSLFWRARRPHGDGTPAR